MSSVIGKNITLSLFGESHGEAIGVVVSGLAPGIPLDMDHIRRQMDLRRPAGKISTARREADEIHIVSGFFDGYTTGTPLTILIHNGDTQSRDYASTRFLPRPGHADYTAFAKYGGFQDYRGGGHFSGRITAPLVAAGAIALQVLARHGVTLGTHIARCARIDDRPFAADPAEDLARLAEMSFPVLDDDRAAAMRAAIENAHDAGDSVGGILETVVLGMPAGVGEPFFHSVESVLSHMLYSIPAVKGVEFGDGFALADMYGSLANDPFRMEEGRVVTSTNRSGGINGGITNGMPILFRTCIKPTPSIYRDQETVDLAAEENATLSIRGRHDPCIVHRARVVVDSLTAVALLDLLCERAGTAWMREE